MIYYLAALPYRLDRPLNMKRVYKLFEKQRPGLVTIWKGTTVMEVTEKVFKEWVRRNAFRFMATVAELDKAATKLEGSREPTIRGWIQQDLDHEPDDPDDDVPFDVMSTIDFGWADF